MQALTNQYPDFTKNLSDTFRRIAVPALALGAGTGALTGYLSSGAKEGETPQERRHRILRNAIVGAALGGTAGVALPMGLKALSTPLHTHTEGPVEGMADSAINFGANHALPAGALAGAGVLGWHWRDKDRIGALKHVADNVGGVFRGPGGPNMVRGMTGDKSNTANLLFKFMHGAGEKSMDQDLKPDNLKALFRANEMLQEAGRPGLGLNDMSDLFEGGLKAVGKRTSKKVLSDNVREAFRQHLADSGPIGGIFSNLAKNKTLPFAETLAKLPGLGGIANLDPIVAGEMYSRLARPGAGELMGRVPWPVRLGVLGGGVLGANELQKRLMGQ